MNRVLNFEKSSRDPRNRRESNLKPTCTSPEAPVSISDLITAVESVELGLEDTATIDSVPYCKVYMNYNHRSSKCAEIKDLKAFIRAHSCHFNHWLQRQDGCSRNSFTEAVGNRHKSKQEVRSPELPQYKQWRPNNQPSSSYTERNSRESTVRSWNKATLPGSPPPKLLSSKN